MSRRSSQLAIVPKAEPASLRPIRSLTPKQEAFARAYVETGNASEAYRRSYDVSPDAKPEGITVNAAQLLANANVALRVHEIEAECLAATKLTIERLASEGFAILSEARAGKDHRAAITALTTLERLFDRLAPARSVKRPDDDSPTGAWLEDILGSDRAIDRPPQESREQWMARQARQALESGRKVSDAELLTIAADGKDPRAWLEEQVKAVTPDGKRELQDRVTELLQRQSTQASADDEFPLLAAPK